MDSDRIEKAAETGGDDETARIDDQAAANQAGPTSDSQEASTTLKQEHQQPDEKTRLEDQAAADHAGPTSDSQESSTTLSQEHQQPDEKAQGVQESSEHDEEKLKAQAKGGPAGGFDDTPVPRAPLGYTVKFTFLRATALPMADVSSRSSDPFLIATLNTGLPTRHKEDPPLQYRSKVIWKNTNPQWDEEWVVANIPASGFKMKIRLYDEDVRDLDDRLGNVHISVPKIDAGWSGIQDESFKIKKRMASKRAYLVRAVAVALSQAEDMSGRFHMSAELLGRTEGQNGGRAYTISPLHWSKHYSPIFGRIAGVKSRESEDKVQRYNFEAHQIQLYGPVPEELYHRYVEFRPFVKSMFTNKGVRGFVLGKALHHQHSQIYNHNKSTVYGCFDGPSEDVTATFLEFLHHDEGGRIFTYVITLDALWRFTETGKEFGIDLLSKHTMHSDVNIYIAFSGEFFIRRVKQHHHHRSDSSADAERLSSPAPSRGMSDDTLGTEPANYELFIDNDSGTYRPNAKLLPLLKSFLESNLPGLKISTLDCQADAEYMGKLKQEQRDRKNKEGQKIIYSQASRSSSISSSEVPSSNEDGGQEEAGSRAQISRQAKLAVKGYASQKKHFAKKELPEPIPPMTEGEQPQEIEKQAPTGRKE